MVGRRSTPVIFIVVATFVCCLGPAAGRSEATGELTPTGCVDDNDSGLDTCAASGDGMDNVTSVVVSPDGRSVYAAAIGESAALSDDAVSAFSRDTSTGGLTPLGCVDDNDTGGDACATSTNGLNDVSGLAVSPDGEWLYAVSNVDDAIVTFDRNTTTGVLTPIGCIEDVGGPDACAASGTDALNGAFQVVISPDGNSLYVAARNDNAVTGFSRNIGTGALTFNGCVDDDDNGTGTCGATMPGLGAPEVIAMDGTGTAVYLGARVDDAIARLSRNTGTGALTPQGCVDDEDTGADACAQSTSGLDAPVGIAVSHDGTSLYIGARGDNDVVAFDRAANGAIFPAGCIEDNTAGVDECVTAAPALDGAFGIAVSADDLSVYSTAADEAALARFDRETDGGALDFADCVDDAEATQGLDTCATTTRGLDEADAVAISPDDRSLYVGARGDDDAVTAFRRALAPPPTPTPTPTPPTDIGDDTGDGEVNVEDDCPAIEGNERGCPVLGRRLTLRYGVRDGAFRGRLISSAEDCRVPATIGLLVRRDGEFDPLATDVTDANGRFLIERPGGTDRYEARVDATFDPRYGHCPELTSNRLQLLRAP